MTAKNRFVSLTSHPPWEWLEILLPVMVICRQTALPGEGPLPLSSLLYRAGTVLRLSRYTVTPAATRKSRARNAQWSIRAKAE